LEPADQHHHHRWSCDRCGETFAAQQIFEQHAARICQPWDGRRRRRGSSASGRQRREASSGGGQSKHGCSYPGCSKQFASERDLRDHANCHVAEEDGCRSYLCPDCGDTFRSSKQMSNHREKHKVATLDT
jgi:uncharacterized C2H2 Zn-finger protein